MNTINNLMLVDDDKTSNFLNKKILSKFFTDTHIYDFLVAEEAIFFLENSNTKIDLILLDINMPDINGWELIDILKENSKIDIPSIIMLSSSVDEQDMQKSKSYNEVKGFITKPLKLENLEKYLDKI